MKKIEVHFEKKEKINNTNWTFKENNKFGMLTHDLPGNIALSMNYKNFTVDQNAFVDENDWKLHLVYINDKNALDTVVNLLKNGETENFWEAILMIEEAFSKKKKNILKFRGDLAEAIFCLVMNGEKNLDDKMSSDILLNGNSVEIKSLSPKKREFKLTKTQSDNDIETYSVFIKEQDQSKGGMSLTEIAASFKGRNQKFKKYLNNTYANTDIGNIFRYKVDETVIYRITPIVYHSIKNENIVSATIRVPDNLEHVKK